MLFAPYIDPDADTQVRLELDAYGSASGSGDPVPQRLASFGKLLRSFDEWLGARGIASHEYVPPAFTAVVPGWFDIGDVPGWPWPDLAPSDFADSGGERLARVTPAQARTAGVGPGGGVVPSVADDGLQLRPVLPGDDVPGAFGIRPDTVAVTVESDVRVRTRPEVSDASIKLEPLLAKGDALYVIGGPVEGSGYRWYEVFAPRSGLAGFVAGGSKDGQSWIESRPLRCHTGGSGDNEYVSAELFRLACYKGREFSSRATLAAVTTDGLRCPDVLPYAIDPYWLQNPLACAYEFGTGDTGGSPGVSSGVLYPTLEGIPEKLLASAADPKVGVEVIATGSLDHPDSRACTAEGYEPPPPIALHLECRSTFVITELRLAP
jgi:hypothetical protein